MTDAQISNSTELESELRDATPDSQEHTEDSLETADPLGTPGNEQAQLDAEARLEDDGPDGQAAIRRRTVTDSAGQSHTLTLISDGDNSTQDPVLINGRLVGTVNTVDSNVDQALTAAAQRFGQASTVDTLTQNPAQSDDELQAQVAELNEKLEAALDEGDSDKASELAQELLDTIEAARDDEGKIPGVEDVGVHQTKLEIEAANKEQAGITLH